MVGRAAAWRGQVRHGEIGFGMGRSQKLSVAFMLHFDRENEQLAGIKQLL
jgi:hypothetical protein